MWKDPIKCSCEADVHFCVRILLDNLLSALKLKDIRISAEISVFQYTPDLWILQTTVAGHPTLIGVVEVKKLNTILNA